MRFLKAIITVLLKQTKAGKIDSRILNDTIRKALDGPRKIEGEENEK